MNDDEFLEQCLREARSITGVLHVGAHTGQEAELYNKHRIDRVTWIEANPDLRERLEAHVKHYGHRVIMAAVAGKCRPAIPFYVASNDGASSSLLPMARHKDIWPDVTQCGTQYIPAETIDSLHRQYDLLGHNFWVLDIQGMEAAALSGAARTLGIADYVLCEFTGALYEHGATLEMIDTYLSDFTAVAGWRSETGETGEVFYQRFRRSGPDLLRCCT